MFDRRLLIGLAGLAALLASPLTALADSGGTLRIAALDADAFPIVRLKLFAADAQGKPLRDLKAADVVLRENGDVRRATITSTSTLAPLRLVIALDVSGSMGGQPLADARSAISTITGSLGQNDEVALVTFNAKARVAQAPTTNKALVANAANASTAGGATAIYDAVIASTDLLAAAPPNARRAFVLVTDGDDNSSIKTRSEAARRISELAIPVFAIGLGVDPDWATLRALSDASNGGRVVSAATSSQLVGIFAAIGEQIESEYRVEFTSGLGPANAGSSAEVQVQVVRNGTLVADAKTGYRVPAQQIVLPQPSAEPVAPIAIVIDKPAAPPLLPPGLVGLLAAASVLAFLLWLSEVASRWPARQRRRLEVFVRGLTATAPEHAKRRSLVQRVVGPSLRSVGAPILRFTPASMIESTRRRLEQAGEPMSIAPAEFIAVRLAVAVVAGLMTLAVVIALKLVPPLILAGVALGTVLGYALPGLVLDAMVHARMSGIRRALPAAMDMLALSVEAGLSFDGAVAQVAQRWDTPFSDELRHLLLQFQMGRDRREVLRELGARTGLSEVVRFANAVIQADSFGAPLSKVLQEQAEEMRTHRRQRAEELARKAPVKMLFPLVLLIFPALFVVILGPAVPRLLVIFGGSF